MDRAQGCGLVWRDGEEKWEPLFRLSQRGNRAPGAGEEKWEPISRLSQRGDRAGPDYAALFGGAAIKDLHGGGKIRMVALPGWLKSWRYSIILLSRG